MKNDVVQLNKNLPQQVRDCRLTGLLDLALEKDYVRTKIADYLNTLIDIGVAGFRLDASKHMWPGDIKAILDKLNNLNTKWFSAGSRPFIFQEVHQYNQCMCMHIIKGHVVLSTINDRLIKYVISAT